MGRIAAVRKGSDADVKGIQAGKVGEPDTGHKIAAVEVTRYDGKVLRYSAVLSKDRRPDLIEEPLDPLKLPSQLDDWAEELIAKNPTLKNPTVKLTVERWKSSSDSSEPASRD